MKLIMWRIFTQHRKMPWSRRQRILNEHCVVGKSHPAAQVWCSSNTSESTNSMFEIQDTGVGYIVFKQYWQKWFWELLPWGINTKIERVLSTRWATKVRSRWDCCVGFEVANLREIGRMVTIFRHLPRMSSDPVSYNIGLVQKSCDCGEWQEHGVPCIDTIVHMRFYQNISLQQILDKLAGITHMNTKEYCWRTIL
jgi:SWIM zinc finger